VVIVAAVRTPFGRFGGAFRDLTAADLGAVAVREVVRRARLDGPEIDQVILGNCAGSITLGQVPARQAALKAGLPESVPVFSLEQACTAALLATRLGYQLIRHDEAEIVVTGGMESMSQVPYVLPGARFGYRLGNNQVIDALVNALTCPITGVHMGVYGGRGAAEHGITRQEQDLWAWRSHRRYFAAKEAGKFVTEIVPVEVPDKKGAISVVEADEQPRADTSLEQLARLPVVFAGAGTITAGNAPGLNDGAAALVMMSAAESGRRGLKPLARVVAVGQAAAGPAQIAEVPVLAAQDALQRAGLTTDEIDLWEINEAFAAVTLVSIKLLGLDPERVNVNGGSVAIGHPVGATGARILMTLVYELRRRAGRYGLATICGAGAHGQAMIVEVV
jgi:acetyl-CoA C-acetyltransferase